MNKLSQEQKKLDRSKIYYTNYSYDEYGQFAVYILWEKNRWRCKCVQNLYEIKPVASEQIYLEDIINHQIHCANTFPDLNIFVLELDKSEFINTDTFLDSDGKVIASELVS